MKFCYLDESGTGKEPYPVMVGVVVDGYRAQVTRDDWEEILEILSDVVGRPIREFHARKFYSGNGLWRRIGGHERAQICSELLRWFSNRGHHVVFSALDRDKFNRNFGGHPFAEDVETPWRFLAFHIVLALQKHHQRHKKGKGRTIMVFDEQVIEKDDFTALVLDPPEWSDTYYARARKQGRLDQIIDVPHFVDSKHVGLVQVADLMAFIMRRYLELEQGGADERYGGERARICDWAETIKARCFPRATTYPRQGICDASRFFREFAPEMLI